MRVFQFFCNCLCVCCSKIVQGEQAFYSLGGMTKFFVLVEIERLIKESSVRWTIVYIEARYLVRWLVWR